MRIGIAADHERHTFNHAIGPGDLGISADRRLYLGRNRGVQATN